MRQRRFQILVTLIAALAMLISACAMPVAPEAGEAQPAAAEPAAGEETTITFWHAMSGSRGEVVDDLVNSFNEMRTLTSRSKPSIRAATPKP